MLYINNETDLVTVPPAGRHYSTADKDRVTWVTWSEKGYSSMRVSNLWNLWFFGFLLKLESVLTSHLTRVIFEAKKARGSSEHSLFLLDPLNHWLVVWPSGKRDWARLSKVTHRSLFNFSPSATLVQNAASSHFSSIPICCPVYSLLLNKQLDSHLIDITHKIKDFYQCIDGNNSISTCQISKNTLRFYFKIIVFQLLSHVWFFVTP